MNLSAAGSDVLLMFVRPQKGVFKGVTAQCPSRDGAELR